MAQVNFTLDMEFLTGLFSKKAEKVFIARNCRNYRRTDQPPDCFCKKQKTFKKKQKKFLSPEPVEITGAQNKLWIVSTKKQKTFKKSASFLQETTSYYI